jgi:hypothetical protein
MSPRRDCGWRPPGDHRHRPRRQRPRGCFRTGHSDATFGFSDKANLDEGAMWPTSFALNELTAVEEAMIGALVKKAVS